MTVDMAKTLAVLDRLTDRTAAALDDVRDQIDELRRVVSKLDQAGEDAKVDTEYLLYLVYELEDAFDVLDDQLSLTD